VSLPHQRVPAPSLLTEVTVFPVTFHTSLSSRTCLTEGKDTSVLTPSQEKTCNYLAPWYMHRNSVLRGDYPC